MISVKILGSGCRKCLTLEFKVRELIKQNNIEASVEKINDLSEIVNSGIMMTPGLIINGQIKSYGIIPKDVLLIDWLAEK